MASPSTACLWLLMCVCCVGFDLSCPVRCCMCLCQRHCEKCGDPLSSALIKAYNKRHKRCRSPSSSSSQPTPAPIPAIVVTPVTPAIIPSLASSASAAPRRLHIETHKKVSIASPQLAAQLQLLLGLYSLIALLFVRIRFCRVLPTL